jgi:hypothetical protein
MSDRLTTGTQSETRQELRHPVYDDGHYRVNLIFILTLPLSYLNAYILGDQSLLDGKFIFILKAASITVMRAWWILTGLQGKFAL